MSTHNLPADLHDLVLWFFSCLGNLQRSEAGSWEGTAKNSVEFNALITRLAELDTNDNVAGIHSEAANRIQFYPSKTFVFYSFDDLLRMEINRRQIPHRFSVVELGFTYSAALYPDSVMPGQIRDYISTVSLWLGLQNVSVIQTNDRIAFVRGRNQVITVLNSYEAKDLQPLSGLADFLNVFFVSEMHKDQKRSLFVEALFTAFKSEKIELRQVISSFSEIVRDVENSYAIFMDEFSYDKARSEIEKRNHEDLLRLNKVLSEIQNQLLAIPAAVLLVGSSIKQGENVRNIFVILGIGIFFYFICILIGNQRSSVNSILDEVSIRKNSLKKLPREMDSELVRQFENLNRRSTQQLRTLKVIFWLAVFLFLSTVILVASLDCWTQIISYCLKLIA